jgi:methyl-accepting chemotaxis protein PixJ
MTQKSSGRVLRNSKGVSTPNFANSQVVEQAITPLSEDPQTQVMPLFPSPEKQTDLLNSPTFSQKKSSRWWGERRLRFKVMTLAVTLATLPVIGIGAAAYYFTNQTFTQRVIAEREGYSLSVQSKISLFLRRRVGDIRVMSQLSIFTDPRQRAELDTQQKQEALDRFVEAYEVYDNIAVVDLKGDVIAQSIGERLPNLSDRKYFQEALKADQPIISQPEAGTLTKVLSIYIVAPIKDSVTNKTIALIQARIPGDYFRTDVFSEEAQRGSSKIYLVDGSGRLFVTPQGVGASSVDDQGRPTVNAEGKVQAIDARSIFPDYNQLRDEDKPRVELSSEKLVTLTPIDDIRDLPPLTWKLLITEDKASVFAAQNQLLLTLEVGVGVVILLAGVIAALVANRAVIPILTATNAVTKIGQGDFDTRVNIQGKDEIAVLGANINQMATQLQRSLAARAFEVNQERVLTDAKGSGTLRAPELQAVFDQAVESVRDLLQLDRVVIYRFNNDVGIVSESVGADWLSAIDQQISDSCIPEDIREAYRKGRVIAANDISQISFSLEHLKLLENLEVKAMLIVPIVGADQLFGLLIAHYCSSTYNWQEFEISFLKRLAYEIGLTIYRVELLEQTTKLAEEQRQLKEGLQKRALALLQEVDPISKGDLMIRAKVTADEIGTIADSYNATVDSLRKIVLQVQESTDQVVETTSMSETSVQLLSTEALRQAEEIAAALESVKEMAVAVREVAVNAEQAEIAVQLAAETVKEGDEAMNRTVDGIQAIRVTVAETAKKVKYLGESSQKISTVVDLISAFAAQTNMLALNASIAASRAGEEGKGFAVVAEEVRALARQSAEATEEIKKLIINIQTETREVVAAMESGTEQVVAGTKLVDETRQSLNKITAVSNQISHLVDAIAQATVVQSKASETVAETIQDVATIANKTSNEADQVSSSFAQLRRVAQALQESVGKFKVS